MALLEKTQAVTALKWLGRVVDLVYPRNCQFCATPLDEDHAGVICPVCLAQAKPIEPPFCQRCALPFAGKLAEPFECGYCKDLKLHFSRAVAACRAEGVVRDCIHRFKYNREMYFEEHLAGWLIQAGQRWVDWKSVAGIVPVPLYPRKERQREFNQAERLARALGRAVDVPVLPRVIKRVKETDTQTRLDAAARRANVRAAFVARGGAALAGQRVVIVDDVFTTGATLDSCARVLRHEGALDVIALTVARGV
jgi:competence protein ComFC